MCFSPVAVSVVWVMFLKFTAATQHIPCRLDFYSRAYERYFIHRETDAHSGTKR